MNRKQVKLALGHRVLLPLAGSSCSQKSMSCATTPRRLAVAQGAGSLRLGEQHSLEHSKGRARERWEALNSLRRAELFKCLSDYRKKPHLQLPQKS